MQRNMLLRYRLVKFIRDYLDERVSWTLRLPS